MRIPDEPNPLMHTKDMEKFSSKTGKFFKKTWDFLKSDSWSALLVDFIIAFVIIKFIFFPLLSLATGAALPLVIVESCSMYHSQSFQQILSDPIYSNYNIGFNDAQKWNFKNGINKGDIIFVISPKNLKAGDVIIFEAGTQNPIIHRIIKIDNGIITTKGDHNAGLLEVEKNIRQENVYGKAVFRIPYLGWIKLVFFDIFKAPGERGFCV